MIKIKKFLKEGYDFNSNIKKCDKCRDSEYVHVTNVSVFENPKNLKVTAPYQSEVAKSIYDAIVKTDRNIRGSIVITEYTCEHCGDYARVEQFHKGMSSCVYIDLDTYGNGGLWRD